MVAAYILSLVANALFLGVFIVLIACIQEFMLGTVQGAVSILLAFTSVALVGFSLLQSDGLLRKKQSRDDG